MKNILIITIDGFPQQFYQRSVEKKLMPFTTNLFNNGQRYEKAYSLGPYTEAAIMSYHFGQNTLDNGAYLYTMLKSKDSFFHDALNKNYSIFTTYYASFLSPDLYIKGSYTYNINDCAPCFSRFIDSKFQYYKKVFDGGQLEQTELKMLSDMLSVIFEVMIIYCDDMYLKNDFTNDNLFVRTKKRVEYIYQWREELQLEFDKFSIDKQDYIDKFLINYEEHFLLKECNLDDVIGISNVFLEDKLKYDEKIFKKITKLNTIFFIKNCLLTNKLISRILRKPTDMRNYLRSLCYATFKQDYSKMTLNHFTQIMSSAKHDINDFIEWYDKIGRTNQFLAYLHFDEFHRPVSFLTFEEYIEEEFEDIEIYLQSLTKDYKGNIVYDLAARYLDKCIKYLFESLPDLLDNTTVILTADHGIANSMDIIRVENNNCFCDEVNHIPFIILDKDMPKKIIDDFITSKDIKNIISSLINNDNIGDLDTDNEFVLTEYAGSGVPDLLRKPVLFGMRTKTISYSLEVKLKGNFGDFVLTDYYNLIDDSLELNNLVRKSTKKLELPYIGEIEKRYIELKENYYNWLEKI